MKNQRKIARLCTISAAAAFSVLALATPASAHVTVSPTDTSAGSYSTLTVSVPHGCDGSATKRVAIQIPEDVLTVVPTRHPLWKVTVKQEKLAEPVEDAHGNKLTERDAVVIYTAKTPLKDGLRDAFELVVKLPEDEGIALAFPTIQTCEEGKTAWTEIAAEGQDSHDLDRPAPMFTTTAAMGDGHGHSEKDGREGHLGDRERDDDHDDDSDGYTMGALGLGAGVLGLLAGGASLVQGRRKP